ncbi:MAG: helix-turn-helix domain-containing protein [Candidatus Dormibacteraceae bacterium]
MPSPVLRPPASVKVHVNQLRREMYLRGFSGSELARKAGVSQATVSHALNGRRILPAKLRALAAALIKVELIPGIDGFIAPDEEESATEGVA